MGIISIDDKTAGKLRAAFWTAREDIRGECKKYHYPLLAIWKAIDPVHGNPVPRETLDAIGIPSRDFDALRAEGFTIETTRGNGDAPDGPYKRTYIARHLQCLDMSTPDSIGSLLPDDLRAKVQANVDTFRQKNPNFDCGLT